MLPSIKLSPPQADPYPGGGVSTANANHWLGWAVPIGFAVLCGPLLGADITVFDDLDDLLE